MNDLQQPMRSQQTDHEETPLLRRWLLVSLIVAIGIAAVFAFEFNLTARLMAGQDQDPKWNIALNSALPSRLALFALGPFIAILAVLCNPARRTWGRFVLISLLAASAGAIMIMNTEDFIGEWVADEFPPESLPMPTMETMDGQMIEIFDEQFIERVKEDMGSMQTVEFSPGDHETIGTVGHFLQHLFEILAFAGLALTPALAFEYREREQRRIVLARELALAENHVLRAQLQPHFLFNALNGIQVLVDVDPERAKDIVLRLSELLRMTLEESDRPLTLVERELAILKCFIEIEETRFGDRIAFSVTASEEALTASLPSLSLQPLVENAIKHGPGSTVEGGSVNVLIGLENADLVVDVSDDGPGVSGEIHEGHGIGNLRKRLDRIFPGQQLLETGSSSDGGFRVTFRIPQEDHDESDSRPHR